MHTRSDPGTNPHESHDGVCWPLASECVSCPTQEHAYTSSAAAGFVLYASGSCHSLEGGTVVWHSPTTLSTRGPATIRGPCPLIVADNIFVENVTLVCDSGAAAIAVVGTGVKITNVHAVNAPLLRAANVKGVDVTGLVVTGSTSTERLLAVLGHTEGDWAIDCPSAGNTVVAQPLSGRGTVTNCVTVDLKADLDVFGRRHEVRCYNKDADVDNEVDFYAWLNGVLFILTLVFGVTLFLVHRQDLYLVYEKVKGV